MEKKIGNRYSAVIFLPSELKESLSSEAINSLMDEMSLTDPITDNEYEIFKMFDEKEFQIYFTLSLSGSGTNFVGAVLEMFKKIKKIDLESVLQNENNMNLLEFHEKVKSFEFTIEFYNTSMTETRVWVLPYLIRLNESEIIKPLNVYDIEMSEKNLRKSKLVTPNEKIYETEAFWDVDNDIIFKIMSFYDIGKNKVFEVKNKVLVRLSQQNGFITDTEIMEIIEGIGEEW